MIKPVALLLFIGLGFSQSRDYPNFEVIINNNPYSKPIFLHSMSGANRYMAIIDSNLNVIWNII